MFKKQEKPTIKVFKLMNDDAKTFLRSLPITANRPAVFRKIFLFRKSMKYINKEN